ncbi:MAG: glutaredoxin family protein [Gammaproteobacteria bacterium]
MIKNNVKRLSLALLLLFTVTLNVFAETEQRPFAVYLFWAEGCPHCAREMDFVKQWLAGEPRIRMHAYEVTQEPENRVLYASLVQYFGVERPAVPFIVIGGRYIQGFIDEATTGEEIKAAAIECLKTPCADIVQWLKTLYPVE